MKKVFTLILASTALIVSAGAQSIEKQAPQGFDSLRLDIVHGKIDTITYTSKP